MMQQRPAHGAITLVTAPSVLPVSLTEAKAFSRVDGSAEDTVISMMIAAACSAASTFTGLVLGQGTWRLTLDAFAEQIELPVFPVLSIASVSYLDGAGEWQTLAAETYVQDLLSRPSWVVRNEDYDWPDTKDTLNAIRIDMSAGHTPVTLPDNIRLAILSTVDDWYNRRAAGQMPSGALELLRQHRRIVL